MKNGIRNCGQGNLEGGSDCIAKINLNVLTCRFLSTVLPMSVYLHKMGPSEDKAWSSGHFLLCVPE